MKPPPEKPGLVVDRAMAEKTRAVPENRVKAYGGQNTLEPGRVDRLLLDIPSDSERPWSWWRSLVTIRGVLEFKEKVSDPKARADVWVTRLTGDSIADAHFTTDRLIAVSITLTPEGRQEFAILTTRLVGKEIGIFLDGRMVSAPSVREPITKGTGEIAPMRSEEEAEKLARILRSHATPTIVDVMAEPPTR